MPNSCLFFLTRAAKIATRPYYYCDNDGDYDDDYNNDDEKDVVGLRSATAATTAPPASASTLPLSPLTSLPLHHRSC